MRRALALLVFCACDGAADRPAVAVATAVVTARASASASARATVDDAQAAALAAQADAMQLHMLSALDDGDAGAGSLKLGAGDGPVQAGKGADGLAGIGGEGRATAAEQGRVEEPKANVSIDSVGAPTIKDADRVVAGLRPQLRRCYQTGLNSGDPAMKGSIIISATVEKNGDVGTAKTVSADKGISDDVKQCMSRVMRRATFNPPGSATLIKITLTVERQ